MLVMPTDRVLQTTQLMLNSAKHPLGLPIALPISLHDSVTSEQRVRWAEEHMTHTLRGLIQNLRLAVSLKKKRDIVRENE